MLYKKYVSILFITIFFSLYCFTYCSELPEEFIANSVTLDLPKRFSNKKDVSCLIVDLKYDGNTIKILELGNIMTSILSSHESIFGKGIIWKRFYDYLQELDLPLWCIGNPTKPKHATFISFEELIKLGAFTSPSLEEFMQDALFNNLLVSNNSKPKGVLAVSSYYTEKKKNKDLKGTFPGFLFLNEIVYGYAMNKYRTNILFHDKELAKYKPQWRVYPKIYSSYVVNKIKNDFDSDLLVIKPINASLGRGVIIVEKKRLDETLKTIFTDIETIKDLESSSYNYWAKDKNREFLVESFEPSKPIILDGERYDAKIRVAFVLACWNGKLHLKFLGSYWKTAEKSIDQVGTLIEKHKSKVGKGGKKAPLSYEDAKHVQEMLSYVLPKLYIKMMVMEKNIDVYVQRFKRINFRF